VKIASGNIIRTRQPQGLEVPHVIRLERELVPNCVIKIHGKPTDPAELKLNEKVERTIFSIGLYRNALEHNPTHKHR
jgi:hypothetical protein